MGSQMNEQIQKLAVQAGLISDEFTPSLKLTPAEQRFAELIVRECAKVAYKYTNKTETHELYDEVGWDCLPGDLKIQIEEHFGVEQ